jgi:hypothetical protein
MTPPYFQVGMDRRLNGKKDGKKELLVGTVNCGSWEVGGGTKGGSYRTCTRAVAATPSLEASAPLLSPPPIKTSRSTVVDGDKLNARRAGHLIVTIAPSLKFTEVGNFSRERVV